MPSFLARSRARLLPTSIPSRSKLPTSIPAARTGSIRPNRLFTADPGIEEIAGVVERIETLAAGLAGE
jgi:hypothetical protein